MLFRSNLPFINHYASQISIKEQNATSIKVVVSQGDSLYKKGKQTYLLGIHKDSLCFASVGVDMYELSIPKAYFPAGTSKLLLFNEAQEVVSERTFFISKPKEELFISTDKQNYDIRAFRPAVFVGEVFDKIITGNGYTWESKFFDTNFAKSLIIPNNQERLLVNKTQALYSTFDGFFVRLFTDSWRRFPFLNIIGDAFTPDDNEYGYPLKLIYNAANTIFNSDIIIQGNVQIRSGIDSNIPNPGKSSLGFYIDFKKNGIIINRVPFYFEHIISTGVYTFPFSYIYNQSLSLNTNDYIEIEVNVYAYSNINKDQIDIITPDSYIKLKSQVPILLPPGLGDTIQINDCLPLNVKQKDFFTSILKMFYLMVTEDKTKDRKSTRLNSSHT